MFCGARGVLIRLALPALCAACPQVGMSKPFDDPGAKAQAAHLGLPPPPGQERVMPAKAFLEHLGLAGGLLLVAPRDRDHGR